MTFYPSRPPIFALLITCVLALPACSSSSAAPRVQLPCYIGAPAQVANPLPGQSGVSATIGQVKIVSYGNNNALYNNYGQWQTTLVDNFGMPTAGGQLTLVSDPSGPHPYPSDFYYGSSIPQLLGGRQYTVYLSLSNGSCSAVSLNSFST